VALIATLSLANDQPAVSPAVIRIVGADGHLDSENVSAPLGRVASCLSGQESYWCRFVDSILGLILPAPLRCGGGVIICQRGCSGCRCGVEFDGFYIFHIDKRRLRRPWAPEPTKTVNCWSLKPIT